MFNLLTPPTDSFQIPRPQIAVQGFAFNKAGQFPILYRTDKVRSAKNCWSLPSGLHEVGLTYAQQFSNELEEELGLKTIKLANGEPCCYHLGSYENILPNEGWHWCMQMLAVMIEDGPIVNKEPDKHDPILMITVKEFYERFDEWKFTSNFYKDNRIKISEVALQMVLSHLGKTIQDFDALRLVRKKLSEANEILIRQQIAEAQTVEAAD